MAWHRAMASASVSKARFSIFERNAMYLTGTAHDRAGRADSAIAYYEQFVNTASADPWDDATYRPNVLFRLGELYEARGNLQEASERYGDFAQLWKNADPELQPRVREARARMARLGTRTG